MSEASLKAKLVKAIEADMNGAVVLRHEELFRSGIPDLSVSWNGKTTWWEAKLADPKPGGRGIQKLTALRLYGQTHCYYIIWVERPGPKRTLVVHPGSVFAGNWDDPYRPQGFTRELLEWPRHDVSDLVKFIRWIHEQ